ncbi:class I SAM-dependent methyltransferase [Leptolyngbya iicbica]|uniref:Class I SAM-dependent methyltransferase n=2 Tax=Cyanophyceae TaxID=3028117 RepID=A0A4Q7EH17_9CYAN|nr:class I SAM-dependent methyltransferase [Leptolyngbya sp. LK]RZM82613.1 class I SAM-dependent methyltransferase [Leptolyngbya sp. LK]
MSSVGFAIFTQKGFEELHRNFPEYREWIDTKAQVRGPKFLFDLQEVQPAEISDGLYDTIFRQAYFHAHYMQQGNFLSVWHQLKKVLELPKSRVSEILEVGKGIGLLEALLECYDYTVTTLDVEARYQPDVIGDILSLPWPDKTFDCVCCFEVLEHLPSFKTLSALKELTRVSRRYVYISLPCQRSSLHFNFSLRFRERGLRRFPINFNFFSSFPSFPLQDQNEAELLKRTDKHGPHYWEVGRKSYPKQKIKRLVSQAGLDVIEDFHNPHHPYHWFLLCEHTSSSN